MKKPDSRFDGNDNLGLIPLPPVNDFVALCTACGICTDVCPFLAEYGTPGRILQKRPELSFYCTACRRCDGVCPGNLSPSAAFLEEKKRLVRQDRTPLPVRKTLAGARRFAKAGHRFPFSYYQSADTVFWPGCGLAANRPGLVRKVRKILSRQQCQQVGLVLDCCYDPVYGLGDTETASAALLESGKRLRDHGVRRVITGCLNCHKLLSEHLEEIQVVFVLEVLPPGIFEKQPRESISLHHPCPSSRWEAIRNKAKVLVDHVHPAPASMGTDFKSVPISESNCCGVGGSLNALYPDLAGRFLNRISDEGKNRVTITYCIGCQNRLLKRGAEAIHLLECLPGVKPRRRIPSPLRQWVNRFALAMAEHPNPLHGFRKIGKGCAAAGYDRKSQFTPPSDRTS